MPPTIRCTAIRRAVLPRLRPLLCYLPLYIFDGRHLLVAKHRQANIDASAGACEEIARIATHLRQAWPDVELCPRRAIAEAVAAQRNGAA